MTIKKINLMLMCLAIVPVYFLCVFTVETTKKIQDNNKQQAIYYAELEEKYPVGTMVMIKLTGRKGQVIGYAYRKLDIKYYHSGTSWTGYYYPYEVEAINDFTRVTSKTQKYS